MGARDRWDHRIALPAQFGPRCRSAPRRRLRSPWESTPIDWGTWAGFVLVVAIAAVGWVGLDAALRLVRG